MSFEFKLPDIGEGIAEGEITQWHVQEGQVIKEDDPFVEVMTDKATVEIPAPRSGRVQSIKVPAGQSVPVGAVIAVIESADAAPAAPASGTRAAASRPEAAPAPERETAARPAAPRPAARAPAAAPPAAAPARAAPPAATGETNGETRRVLAAPAVRRRAREAGVNLSQVRGSGPAGRITRDDLDQFLDQLSDAAEPVAEEAVAVAAPGAPRPAPGSEVRMPLRGIRKRIAERMARSKRTAAHFTYVDEVDVTALVEMRESLKAAALEEGVKLTFMPFIIQAVIHGLKKFPMLNASLDEESSEIVYKHYYNIGFAADTEAGLVVPVIHDADRQSLLGLAEAVQDLAGRAREGKLSLDEVTGSTFTITNAGSLGGILATPVINYPEVAILGVHKIQDRAVVVDGAIVVRKRMNLSISLDHRVVDGADGARFMNDVIRFLEEPKLLLLGTR